MCFTRGRTGITRTPNSAEALRAPPTTHARFSIHARSGMVCIQFNCCNLKNVNKMSSFILNPYLN